MGKYIGSFIRHLLTWGGGALFVQRHDATIDTAVAVLITAVGAGWSALKARNDQAEKAKQDSAK